MKHNERKYNISKMAHCKEKYMLHNSKKDLWIEQHAAGDVCVNFRQGNVHLSGQGVEYIMMKENKGDTRFLKYPSPHHNLILDYWYQEMERSPPVLNNN